MKRFLYKDNQYITYVEYGNPQGFPVIVQHGMIASIKSGALFSDHFKKHARIICLARPGYGESSPVLMENYKEWGTIVSRLADELSLSSFDVFASSAGAPYGYAVGCVCAGKVRNIFVFSGMPAFYDKQVQQHWPYPIQADLSQSDAQEIAHAMFFADASKEMLENDDVKDSIANNCFGPAQELRLRFSDWGFTPDDVKAKVYMQHSKQDEVISYRMAERTAALLPACSFELLETGSHFSVEAYQKFIEDTILPNIIL